MKRKTRGVRSPRMVECFDRTLQKKRWDEDGPLGALAQYVNPFIDQRLGGEGVSGRTTWRKGEGGVLTVMFGGRQGGLRSLVY